MAGLAALRLDELKPSGPAGEFCFFVASFVWSFGKFEDFIPWWLENKGSELFCLTLS